MFILGVSRHLPTCINKFYWNVATSFCLLIVYCHIEWQNQVTASKIVSTVKPKLFSYLYAYTRLVTWLGTTFQRYDSLVFQLAEWMVHSSIPIPNSLYENWWAKVGLQLWVCGTQFTLVSLFIFYCTIFHMHNYKPTFVHPVFSP